VTEFNNATLIACSIQFQNKTGIRTCQNALCHLWCQNAVKVTYGD